MTRTSMRATRDKVRDQRIIDTLRAYDAPMTCGELRELLPDIPNLASAMPDIAIKYPYPVWRLRGTKAGSSSAQYVYSDTKPSNAVRKFPEMSPAIGRLQHFLDIDLTEDANRRAREARRAGAAAAKVDEKEKFIPIQTYGDPGVGKTVIVDPFSGVQAAMVRGVNSFELLEERDPDTIIFKFNGRVFVGKPVRI